MKWGIDQGRGSIPLSAHDLFSNVQPKGSLYLYASSVRCGRTSAVHAVIVRTADNDKSKEYGIITND
jgi:hypothetical protein